MTTAVMAIPITSAKLSSMMPTRTKTKPTGIVPFAPGRATFNEDPIAAIRKYTPNLNGSSVVHLENAASIARHPSATMHVVYVTGLKNLLRAIAGSSTTACFIAAYSASAGPFKLTSKPLKNIASESDSSDDRETDRHHMRQIVESAVAWFRRDRGTRHRPAIARGTAGRRAF